jgi:hypothetical protein
MKKKYKFIAPFILLMLAVGAFSPAKASHYGGLTMTTECINPCTTRIHWRIYRICTTNAGFSPLQTTWSSSNTSCTGPNAINSPSNFILTDVTPICASIPQGCINRINMNIGGAEELHYWRDFEVCSPSACDYTFTYESCCRNTGVTSTTSNDGMSVTNTINLSIGCNNSPYFPRANVMYICSDEDYKYFVGGIDPDGDSLTYDLQDCERLSGIPLNYQAGYSGTSPLGPGWSVTLGHETGLLSIESVIPNQYEVGPVCVRVNEYRGGQLIGTVLRDMYIIVFTCPNNVHYPVISGPTNLSVGAIANGQDSVLACPGQPLCFDMGISDSDSGSIARIWWHPTMNGATFSDANNPSVTDTIYGNPGTAQFCWNNPTPGTHCLIVQSRDNSCPLEREQDRVITLVIGSPVMAPLISGPASHNVCSSIPDTLFAPPGYPSYIWSTGATTSSILVSNPGTYYLTVTPGTGCVWMDSFVVVPDTQPQILGQILDYNSLPLVNEQVDLLRLNLLDSTLTTLATTTTDANGNYDFCNIPYDTVYIQARPDLVSAPGNMLTYADTAIYWNNSLPLLFANFPDTVNFSCRPLLASVGNCTIGGTINHATTQNPQPGLTVILRLPPSMEAVAYTTTDANGYFNLPNLAAGTYAVSVDKPFVDEVNVPMVTLSSQNCLRDSLDFVLHPTFLDQVLVGLDDGFGEWEMSLAPNPADDLVRLQIESGVSREMRICLLDIRGKSLRELLPTTLVMNQLNINFDTSVLPAGLYFIEVLSDGRRKVEKLIVRR